MSSSRENRLKQMENFLRVRLAEETMPARDPGGRVKSALTISRQAGTGGKSIGRKLIDYLGQFDDRSDHGWAFFDRELVARVIGDHKLPDSLARPFREDSRSPINKAIKQILGRHPSDWTLFHYTADTVRKLCHMGNVIVVGRGGNFITRDLPNTFHLRLVGSEKNRVEAVVRDRMMTPADAGIFVGETDRARAGYVRQHLDGDIGDPAAYHLVLNTDLFSGELAARVIGDTLLEWQATRELRNPTAAA